MNTTKKALRLPLNHHLCAVWVCQKNMAVFRRAGRDALEEIEHAAKEQGHSIETFLALARAHGFDQDVLVPLRNTPDTRRDELPLTRRRHNVLAMVPTDDAMSGLPAAFVTFLLSEEGRDDNFVFMRSLILNYKKLHQGYREHIPGRSNALLHQHWVARGATASSTYFYDRVKQGRLIGSGTAIGPSPFSKVHQEFKGSFVGGGLYPDYLVRVDMGDRKKRWLAYTADTAGHVVYTSGKVRIYFTSGLFLLRSQIQSLKEDDPEHGRIEIINPDAPVDLATRVVSKDYNWDNLGYTALHAGTKPARAGAPVVYNCMNVSCSAEAKHVCAHCKDTTYCSEECQRVCWSEHSECCGRD